MEPSKERYNELCRLCASYDAVKMDIFGNEGKNRQLVDKIQTCLPFKIDEDDRLPKCLCYRCMYNLENFYDFRTACVNAVALLERCLPPGGSLTGKETVKKEAPSCSELFIEKEKMPILIPEAPIVNPNAALGTPPRLNSDGEADHGVDEPRGDASCTDDGTAKRFEDTEDRRSDDYEMEMNPSDFLEMTPMVTEESEENCTKKLLVPNSRITEVFQHTAEQHEVYVCSLCNKAFSSKGHLSLHARIHAGAGNVIGAKVVTDDHTSYKRPYQCDLCNKSYSTAKHRWGHVSTTHRGHPAVTCAYCSRIYSTRTNLEEHIKSRHTGLPPPPELPITYVQPDNRYRCKTCPKMYTNVTDLNKHRRVCAADRSKQKPDKKKVPPKSKSLVETFNTSSTDSDDDVDDNEDDDDNEADDDDEDDEDDDGNDYRHAEAKLSKNPHLTILKQALANPNKPKRDYEDRNSLGNKAVKVARMEKNEGEPRKRWYCEMCPENFTSVDRLKEHESIHTAEKPYACILCAKDFALKASLSRHIISAHGVDPGPIIDTDKRSKKSFSLAQRWRKKLRKSGTSGETVTLAGRGATDSSEEAESNHGNMIEIETVFVCEICTRDFNDRASLWLHIRATHKEFAAFACGVCLKICSDNAQLLNHVNMYHGGSKLLVSEQRRYSCTICGRQHDSRKKLMTHVSIHNVDPGYDPASFVQLNTNYHNESFNGTEITAANATTSIATTTTTTTVANANHHPMDFDAEEDSDRVDCYICYKSFPNEDHLIRHQRNAHKSEPVIPCAEATTQNNGPSAGANGTAKAQYHLFFVCELCGSSHPSKWERWLHVSSNHGDDPSMRCEREDCGKIFATKGLRNEHAQHHLIQGASPNTCEVCGKLWGSRVDYWKHVMGVHSDTVPLICGVCLKVFPDVAKLSCHVRANHWPLTNGDFSCDICGRPYSNKSKMSRHRKIHGPEVHADPSNKDGRTAEHRQDETTRACATSSPEPICEMCTDITFENWQSLREHRRTVHALFPCDLCNKCYGRTSHLWKHVNRVHKGHEDVTCRYCMKTSASREHLMAHVAKIHRYEPESSGLEISSRQPTSYEKRRSAGATGLEEEEEAGGNGGAHHCDKCRKSFHKRYLLRRHMKGCQNYRKDPGALLTRCRACERIFKDRASLQKHIENHHSEYTCHLCNETVTSKLGIMTHNRLNHIRHPDLTCEHGNCGKLFRTKEDLESHRRDHKYHTPNVCDFCGDTVDNKLKLKMHVLSLHRNEIGVSCGVCLIPMKDPKDLKKHVEDEHPGVLSRPNTCQVCGKRYASKWKAFDHTKKCHGKVFRTCKQCLAVFTSDTEIRHHYEHVHNVPKDQLAGFENRHHETSDVVVKDEPEDYDYEEDEQQRRRREEDEDEEEEEEEEYYGNDDGERRGRRRGGNVRRSGDSNDQRHAYDNKRPRAGDNHDTHDCEICPEIFLNRETLADHYRNVHNTDPERMFKRIKLEGPASRRRSGDRMMMRERDNFECKNCARQFCTKSLFWNHINVCTRRGASVAGNDGALSSATSILEARLKSNGRIKKEPPDLGLDGTNLNIPDFNLFEDINMRLCEQKPIPNLMPLSQLRHPPSKKSTASKDTRKDSRKVYDESTNTVCICEVCGKQWPAKKHLWQHLIRFHRAEAAVTCGVCLKLCDDYQQLAQHLRSEHDSVLSREGNNFTCKTCGRYHNARSKLLLHMSIHIGVDSGSANGGPARCRKCERSFETEERLEEHAAICEQRGSPLLVERKVIDVEARDDANIGNEEERGSLIGDGASLTGEADEEPDFSDHRPTNSEDTENEEESSSGDGASSRSETEEEEEDEDEENQESRTDSRATTARVTCHSDSSEETPKHESPASNEVKIAENPNDEERDRRRDESKSSDSTRDLDENRELSDDDGPPVLSPVMPLSIDDSTEEPDDVVSHRLSPMLSLNANEENSFRRDLVAVTNEGVLEPDKAAAADAPAKSDNPSDQLARLSNNDSPSDDEREGDVGDDVDGQLDHEGSRIHVVNPDDEYHSDDSRAPEDEQERKRTEQVEEEEEEEEDDDEDEEDEEVEEDGEDEQEDELEQQEVEERVPEDDSRMEGQEEDDDEGDEENGGDGVEIVEENNNDDEEDEEMEEEEEGEEGDDEEEQQIDENSLQIHNLDGTVLMVANDADGNQILIQRNVSDIENDDSIGALSGYIYEDEEYDFAGFQVQDGILEEGAHDDGEIFEEEEVEEEEEEEEEEVEDEDDEEREMEESEEIREDRNDEELRIDDAEESSGNEEKERTKCQNDENSSAKSNVTA